MFYHRETGALHASHLVTSDDSLVALNTPADHLPIDVPDGKRLDHIHRRVNVSTGEVEAFQPPRPSGDHEWNAEAARWQLSAAAQAALSQRRGAKARRAELIDQQHDLVRRLALDPQDAQARAALQALHEELTAINPQIVEAKT